MVVEMPRMSFKPPLVRGGGEKASSSALRVLSKKYIQCNTIQYNQSVLQAVARASSAPFGNFYGRDENPRLKCGTPRSHFHSDGQSSNPSEEALFGKWVAPIGV